MVTIEEIDQDISSVINKINQYEKIRLLGSIASFKLYGVKSNKNELPNIYETTTEYLMSIALSATNDTSLPMTSSEDTISIFLSLKQIREKYITYELSKNISQTISIQENNLRVKAIEKALTVRGIGYRVHAEEIFRELFALHDEKLLLHYNFDSNSLLSFINKIEMDLLGNKEKVDEGYNDLMRWLDDLDSESRFNLMKKYSHLGMDAFLLPKIYQYENPDAPRFREVGDASRVIESDLNEGEKSILKNLSTEFNSNGQFLDPRFKAYPLNDTIINSKPILFDNEKDSYYCFLPELLHRNLFDIVEGLLKKADNNYYKKTYLGKGLKGRSTYFENKVLSLLDKIISGDKLFLNLKYKLDGMTDEYESDGIIETSKHIFLIEVKAGSFASSARRGSLRNLKHDLEELVGKAINQTNRTESYILTSSNPVFYNDTDSCIKFDTSKEIIKITVSFASMTGITNQLITLSELGLFEKTDNLPLALSVTDLMVLSDIFEGKQVEFIDYLKERTGLYFNKNILIEDEIDFLALYISKGYARFKKNILKGKYYILDLSNRHNVDKYYNGVFDRISVTKPKINR